MNKQEVGGREVRNDDQGAGGEKNGLLTWWRKLPSFPPPLGLGSGLGTPYPPLTIA